MSRLLRLLAALGLGCAAPAHADEVVLLLHGLGRSPASMRPLQRGLVREGFTVINLAYPSRHASIRDLSEQALGPWLAPGASNRRVHVVTHSLGGILVRDYIAAHGAPASLGRIVMLAPPNQGSEIVDVLRHFTAYAWLNGPAGRDLGTRPFDAPQRIGPLPAGVEAGVLAGDFSWNPLFSALLPGDDDGKVAVARTHVSGERDHRVLPFSHTWIMRRTETRRQVSSFLRTGGFAQPVGTTGSPPQPATVSSEHPSA